MTLREEIELILRRYKDRHYITTHGWSFSNAGKTDESMAIDAILELFKEKSEP